MFDPMSAMSRKYRNILVIFCVIFQECMIWNLYDIRACLVWLFFGVCGSQLFSESVCLYGDSLAGVLGYALSRLMSCMIVNSRLMSAVLCRYAVC
jgi:hypothetical protein